MEVYSCLDGPISNNLTFKGFGGVGWYNIKELKRRQKAGETHLIRACHQDYAALTCLWGIEFAGGLELSLHSRSGMSAAAVRDPNHHHVTALTKDAAAYAEFLKVALFKIRTKRPLSFMRSRFPEWSSYEAGGVVHATLEV